MSKYELNFSRDLEDILKYFTFQNFYSSGFFATHSTFGHEVIK